MSSFIANTAIQTNQNPYWLCRLLDDYPHVYDAYMQRLYGGEDNANSSFLARREASREKRIRESVSR